MEIIGKVKIKWNDAPVSVPVTADGYIQMPDGTMRRLREETFQGIKEKLLATAPTQQAESAESTEPAGSTEPETSPAPSSEASDDLVQETAAESGKADEPAVPSESEPEGPAILGEPGRAGSAEPESKEPSVPGEPEPKNDAPAQDTGEAASKADRRKERQERKALEKQKKLAEKQKRKEEKLNVQKEGPESTAKTPMSPGKAAAIAVAAVLLAEAVLVAGYQAAPKNGVSLSGPEVTASVSGVGEIPDDAESVLIIARVKGDDGVERDIALGEFSPSV